MITLTKTNAKERCRTCLRKLIKNEYEDTTAAAASVVDDSDKNNFISINTSNEIRELLDKYVGIEGSEEEACHDQEYPVNVCIECVKQLQSFEAFRQRALDSADKLYRVFCGKSDGVQHKIELDDDGVESKDVVREQLQKGGNGTNDVFNLLLKDSLMETEAILLEGNGTDNVANSLDPDPFQTDVGENKRRCRKGKSNTSPQKLNNNQSVKPTRRSKRGKDGETNEITTTAPEEEMNTLVIISTNPETKSETLNNLPNSDDEKNSVNGDDDVHDWPLDFHVEYSDTSSTDNEVLSKRIQRLRKENTRKKKIMKKATKVSRNDNDSDLFVGGGGDSKENEEENKITDFNNDEHSNGLSSESEFEVGLQEKSKKSTLGSTKKRSAASGRKKGLTNSYKCEQCNRRFGHKITLDAHVRKIHQGEKRAYKCELCDKSYSFMGGLTTHMRETHERQEESYECKIPGCEKKYTSYITLQRHVRVKHLKNEVPTRYVCEQCGATFKQTSNLRYHMRTRHPTEDDLKLKEIIKERLECEICKKFFNSQYTLKYHKLRIHADDKKYECKICGRRVAKQFMLDQHMLVHSEDKTACKFCGREFVRKYQVEAHIKAVHQKLKPFQCSHCSESFASRKTLRHHIYIHTGEKPYVCDICGQAYRQPTCLKNHRKIHNKSAASASGGGANGSSSNNNNNSINPPISDTMPTPAAAAATPAVLGTAATIAVSNTPSAAAMNINRNFINNLMQSNNNDAMAANNLDLQ
ncbi:zinc finger protein 286A [Musca vetustissima]|uniref:zinc finger protein 286A n=1 Tax=Musca vetustissima TaxID=27455 RepID=UPI002AB61C02|nr:zinc finger protein 286A [Musca vetustissima]